MKQVIRIIIGLILPLILLSCEQNSWCDCFISGGEPAEEIRFPGEFRVVEVKDNVDLVLREDSVCQVTVLAGKNLLEGITTMVTGDRLVIANTNACNWVRDPDQTLRVIVSCPEFSAIYYQGYGNISAEDTLHCSELRLDVTDGSGTIRLLLNNTCTRINIHEGVTDTYLIGKSGVNYLYNNGIGPLDALELDSRICFVTSNSVGNVFVRVQDLLEPRIFYSGNIYFRGNPLIQNPVITGSGALIPYN